MNIFYLEQDPLSCAQAHCDKHVVKMILEYAQLLSTAHRVADGRLYYEPARRTGRMVKRWYLEGPRSALYSATHVNHPSALWARENRANYAWLYELFTHLLDVYTERYGKKHKCSELCALLAEWPKNVPEGRFTPPTLAMPDEHKRVSKDPVECYRDYYHTKTFAKWPASDTPSWWQGAV
jgi:hypothetical protein